jgi:hypothetical protein
VTFVTGANDASKRKLKQPLILPFKLVAPGV